MHGPGELYVHPFSAYTCLVSYIYISESNATTSILNQCQVRSSDGGTSKCRPSPWMAIEVAMAMETYPLGSCVKVDDTVPGIQEGLNAGMWTVGVVDSGSGMGLSEKDFEGMLQSSPEVIASRRKVAARAMYEAGAHYVIGTVKSLPGVLQRIEERMKNGECAPCAGHEECEW